MTIVWILIAIAVQLVVSFLAYQYVTHRTDGVLDKKHFFALRFEWVPLIVIGIAFLLSIGILLYGLLVEENRIIRAVMNAVVFIWLALLGYVDIKEKIIPNPLIGIGLGCWLVLVLIDIFVGGTPWYSVLVYSLIGGLGIGGVLLIIAMITKSALGMGDVKMFTVLGLLYGLTDTYSILLFSIVVMGLVSVGLLIAKKVTMKTAIPMAPFVAGGFLLSILAGM